MKAVDQLADRPYVLEEERELPEAEQTVFWLRGLPYDVYLAIQEKAAPTMRMPAKFYGKGKKSVEDLDTEVEWKSGNRLRLEFEILSQGLVRVENLRAETGELLEYPGLTAKENAKKEWISRWLPPKARIEIANSITEGSEVTEDEEKN